MPPIPPIPSQPRDPAPRSAAPRPSRPASASPPPPRPAPGGGGNALDLSATSEQQRQRFAWAAAKDADKDFVSLVKGLPALMMASGLMATLAFLEAKSEKASGAAKKRLAQDLGRWLGSRGGRPQPPDYQTLQEALLDCSPRQYRLLTEETLGMLAWLRHFADARRRQEA
jgi:CRISPR-associated protein Cmr5